jgi:hypothetical protein
MPGRDEARIMGKGLCDKAPGIKWKILIGTRHEKHYLEYPLGVSPWKWSSPMGGEAHRGQFQYSGGLDDLTWDGRGKGFQPSDGKAKE